MTADHDVGAALDGDEIRLSLPALVPYSRVARLAVAGLASRNGFSYDGVEDIRIAVGELFGVLTEPPDPASTVSFTCRLPDDVLEITAERRPPRAVAEVTDLTRQILEAVVDETTIDGRIGRITVTKQIDT